VDNINGNLLYVCNLIPKDCRRLPDPLQLKISDCSALAMIIKQQTITFIVVVASSKQVLDDYLQWNLSIEVYA